MAQQAKPPASRVSLHPYLLVVVEPDRGAVQPGAGKGPTQGTFPSQQTLVQKLLEYIDQFNNEGKVFQWTKPAEATFRSLNDPTRH